MENIKKILLICAITMSTLSSSAHADAFSYQYVDLGLSVKWATCNLGAASPEQMGRLYSWGETKPKTTYELDNYKFGNNKKPSKYNDRDGIRILEATDDAASVNLGQNWRTPTVQELNELLYKCKWTMTTRNGTKGYSVKGPNGNSIFLPVRKDGTKQTNAYWSSTVSDEYIDNAWVLDLGFLKYENNYTSGKKLYRNDRTDGLNIRPVYGPSKKANASVTVPDNEQKFVDLGLSVAWGYTNLGASTPEQNGSYYAWGEYESKTNYTFNTYKYGKTVSVNGQNKEKFSKYCGNKDYGYNGYTDKLTRLVMEDDPVQRTLSGFWRMPTRSEIKELKDKCKWKWTTKNSVYGFKVTGPNGNSIFLPAAGYKKGSKTMNRGIYGRYWTSILENENLPNCGISLDFEEDNINEYFDSYNRREIGLPIRPVYSSPYIKGINAINKIVKNMVFVEGGAFTMGAPKGADGIENNATCVPSHQVTVPSFYICKYEVTGEEWNAVMNNDPSLVKGTNMPVENVNYDDCQKFIKKINLISGRRFRLPTEAEWEYAARGGKKSRNFKYSGSNQISSVAWNGIDNGKPHAVGEKGANELGIYDMSGNVMEWCSDWYESYTTTPKNNPKGATSGTMKIIRGGAYFSPEKDCRNYYRSAGEPEGKGAFVGLRLVMEK